MNLLEYMNMTYIEALESGKTYATIDNYEYYIVNDEFILHKVHYLEKYKEILNIPTLFKDMDEGALDEYRDTLCYITLGSIKSIKDYLFFGFRHLRRIEGIEVESVGRYAFIGTKLHGLHLPKLKLMYSNAFMCLNKDNYFYIDVLNLSHLNIGSYSGNLEDVSYILYKIYSKYFDSEIDYSSYIKYKLYNIEERCLSIE